MDAQSAIESELNTIKAMVRSRIAQDIEFF